MATAKKNAHSTAKLTPAEKALRDACPLMRAVIRDVGRCTLETKAARQPYESLIRAVAHQQLHGKAAETILRRFLALYPGQRFPKPEQVQNTPIPHLRSVGFSEAKARSILDIAQKATEGVVPTSRAIARMSDEEILSRLVSVRGVGRWTVEMLLIFQLGRADVLPVDDFGVRAGFRALQVATSLKKKKFEMPTPKELRAYGEVWAPYRTTAAWYLWRAADRAKTEKSAQA